MANAAQRRPESSRTPETEGVSSSFATRDDILRQADRDVLSAKTELNVLREGVRESGKFAVFHKEIEGIEVEIDAAWDDLARETKPLEGDTKAASITEEALGEWREQIDAVLLKQECSLEEFENILEHTRTSPKHLAALRENLQALVGAGYTERLITSTEYRRSLQELQRSLEGRVGENGPELCHERTLKNLVVIYELFGSNARELALAMNLKHYDDRLSYHSKSTDVIQVLNESFDPDADELEAEIAIGFLYGEGEDQSEIRRKFVRTIQQDVHGDRKAHLTVEHDYFNLTPSFKSNGLAANVTAACLRHYDTIGVNDITLHANIDLGGYAWASYGYGWDIEAMTEEIFVKGRIRHAMKKFREQNHLFKNYHQQLMEEARVRATAHDLAQQEFASMDIKEKTNIHFDNVRSFLIQARERVRNAFQQANLISANGERIHPDVQEILAAFDLAMENPAAVTPQHIATIGKKGQKLRRGASRQWYTEDDYQKALASGEELGEDPHLKGLFHAGKIGLQESDWYGKIELKPDGSQSGKNRELLEKKLARSITP